MAVEAVKILAFLQNQWFSDPDGVRQMLARHDKDIERRERVRRRLIHYALFAGCLTGRRLRKIFGALCDSIIWEEGSREVGGKASAFFPPDAPHILATVAAEQPDVVLCFGASNKKVFEKHFPWPSSSLRVIYFPHPAARHESVMRELQEGEIAMQILLQEKNPSGWMDMTKAQS